MNEHPPTRYARPAGPAPANSAAGAGPAVVAAARCVAAGCTRRCSTGRLPHGRPIKAGLVDELQLFLVPTVVGGGKRALPGDVRSDLKLLDTHRFASGVVYLRYAPGQPDHLAGMS